MVEARELQDVDPFTADVDPYAAVESLRDSLGLAGIVLPSLAVDAASPDLRLVELGRARADVAVRLADTLRRGSPAS
ncbi:hypothetical protein AB0N62_43065 [Streptomyces sp. NPDC093982]|uniref:hypothetical protein n=1 Tax=Streptomyces sp. NPDC093982 TaxID=3155077 RepID=UPI0034174556